LSSRHRCPGLVACRRPGGGLCSQRPRRTCARCRSAPGVIEE